MKEELRPVTTDNNSVNSIEQEKALDFALRFSLLKSTKINQGNNGIIKRIDDPAMPPILAEFLKQESKDSAAGGFVFKIMKIYTGGRGRKEFEMQKAAYDIVETQIAKNDGKKYARIPKPYLYRELDVDQETEKVLSEKDGLDVSQKKIEVILMDFIAGEDLAVKLYKAVLKKHPKAVHFKEEEIDAMGIQELQSEVGAVLDFRLPGGKNKDIGANAFEAEKVMNENVEKMIHFLKRKEAVVVTAPMLEKISNTNDLLHKNNIYHRDEHERNIIVGQDGETVFLIDFGESIKTTDKAGEDIYFDIAKGKRLVGDEAILNKYRTLTISRDEEREAELNGIVSKIDEIKNDAKFKEKYNSLFGDINDGNLDEKSDTISLGAGSYYSDRFWDGKITVTFDYIKSINDKERRMKVIKMLLDKHKTNHVFTNRFKKAVMPLIK